MAGSIPIIDSIREVCGGKPVWLCDIWGVLHDGVTAFRSAVEACRAFRGTGGRVVLISNSPRPSQGVSGQLLDLGIDGSVYDAIVTSGDVTRDLVAAKRGKRLYHLGPDRDRGFFDGLDVTFSSADEADVLVCTGLVDDETETPEDYRPMLERFAARHVPMICGNPDLKVERGNKLIPCAGALAELYTSMGQSVVQAGKPYAPIYERAFALLGYPERRQVLAIGDGIDTDIRGAATAGVDAVYIASRVHLMTGELSSEGADALFAEKPFKPLAAMAALTW
jgi:HAD superfamily hydrolase (TIGR01459 family)